MANLGRPRALDDTKRREVCAMVSAGSGIERAAKYVGCNPSTIRREALRNADFHDQLRRAELAAELEPLQLLRKKAATHWRAAAWLLERVNPHRFNKQDVNRLTKDQVEELFEEILEVIDSEMPDQETRIRVRVSIGAAIRQAVHDRFCADHTRRDPHRRNR